MIHCFVFFNQVLSADSGCCLGYLPRSLAQYISPLVEKHCLSFEVGYFLATHEYFDSISLYNLLAFSCPVFY